MKFITQIRWACIAVMLLDTFFFKAGVTGWAFIVWAMTLVHTHSLMEKKYFDDKEKEEKKG